MAKAPQRSAVVPCAEETLFLDILRTADLLARGPSRLLKNHRLSATQYNVLRILRGSPDGLLCGEIAQRMITRDPDITRLLDRLEKRRLIARSRQESDRRMIMARITSAGLELLGRLDQPVQDLHRRQLGHLSRSQSHDLSSLLAAARERLS